MADTIRSVIEDIRERVLAYTPRTTDVPFRARAAVLVPVYEREGEVYIIFTRRTDTVASHKGEISFPGGAVDLTDLDLTMTALRESDEEIGLQPQDVSILGPLDELVTISDYHVTPFVGEIDSARLPYLWHLQEREVAKVLEVPLSHITDARNRVELPRTRDGVLVLQPGIDLGDDIVWGATYRILRNFLEVAVPGTQLPPSLSYQTQPAT